MTETVVIDRMRKVKSILVTQEAPTDPTSPFFKIAEKYSIKIDFRPFIQVEPVPVKEFRKQKIEVLNYTAIIFTSRNAVDHFFSLCRAFAEDSGLLTENVEVVLRACEAKDIPAGMTMLGNGVFAYGRKAPEILERFGNVYRCQMARTGARIIQERL